MKPSVSFFICIFFIVSSESVPCDRDGEVENGELSGEVYENVGNGTIVTTLTFSSTGTNVTYTLGGDLASYFEMDGEVMKVINGTWLDRDRIGLPVGNASKIIFGTIVCTANGTNVTYNSEVSMHYINKEFPIIYAESTITISEYTAVGSTILVAGGGTGDNIGENLTYSMKSQDPEGFFNVSEGGTVTLIKDLNYLAYAQHKLSIGAVDDGPDSTGGTMTRSTSKTITFNIDEYDDLPPLFESCGGSSPPFYTANITTNEEHTNLTITPCQIVAKDGDTALNDVVTYNLTSGSNNYDAYFTIDPDTGQINVSNPVESPTMFLIAVKAAQANRPDDRYTVTYLQILAYTEDNWKPVFDNGSYNGRVMDDGSDIIFATDSLSEELLYLRATDADSPDTVIVYSLAPADTPFEISSGGSVFAHDLINARPISGLQSFSVTAINRDADDTSPNKESDAVTLTIEVELMTTTQPATTEPVTTTQLTMTSSAGRTTTGGLSSNVATATRPIMNTSTDFTVTENGTTWKTITVQDTLEINSSTADDSLNFTVTENGTTWKTITVQDTLETNSSTANDSINDITTNPAPKKSMLKGFVLVLAIALGVCIVAVLELIRENRLLKKKADKEKKIGSHQNTDNHHIHESQSGDHIEEYAEKNESNTAAEIQDLGPEPSIEANEFTERLILQSAQTVVTSAVAAVIAGASVTPRSVTWSHEPAQKEKTIQSHIGDSIPQEETYCEENEIDTKATGTEAVRLEDGVEIRNDLNRDFDAESSFQANKFVDELMLTSVVAAAAVAGVSEPITVLGNNPEIAPHSVTLRNEIAQKEKTMEDHIGPELKHRDNVFDEVNPSPSNADDEFHVENTTL